METWEDRLEGRRAVRRPGEGVAVIAEVRHALERGRPMQCAFATSQLASAYDDAIHP
jgi:hypothetical protein